MATKKTCLILKFMDLPKERREDVKGWTGFNNDCYLPLRSEFSVDDLRRGMRAVTDYWIDQRKRNGFEGTLTEFIKKYRLNFEVWLIDQKFDLEGVDEIVIDTCY